MKLRCENLVKKYGPRTVVKGVSMEVEQGEIVGFLGPNGAGKTTSFYMITVLIVPNAGRIYLDDEDITSLPMFKRAQKGVGYLAQEASVFRHMSVEDNIMSVMEMSKQFTKLVPSIASLVCYVASLYLLSLCLRTIPIGITYATWSALGIALITVSGIFFFKQMPDLGAIIGLVPIISGVAVLNLFSKMDIH